MKLLISSDGDNYLVDLDKLKAKSVKELVTETGDDKLMTLDASSLRTTTMDELLAQALKPKVADTTTPRSTSTRTTSTSRSSGLGEGRSKEEKDVVRAWGKANSYDVKEVGRIKDEVYVAYDAAHPK